MKKVSFLSFLALCGISLGVNAQMIWKCSLPGERVVYSDRKCNPLEKGGRLKITDNVIESPGSDARRSALRAARLSHQVRAPFVDSDQAHASFVDNSATSTTGFVGGERWDGDSEAFTVYPFLGPGMYLKR